MQRGLETLEFRTTGVLLVLLDLPASDPADSECSCAGLTGSFCWAPFWSFAVLDALRSYQILSILSILSTSKIDLKKSIYIIYQVDFFLIPATPCNRTRLATPEDLEPTVHSSGVRIGGWSCWSSSESSKTSAQVCLGNPTAGVFQRFFQQLCTKQEVSLPSGKR